MSECLWPRLLIPNKKCYFRSPAWSSKMIEHQIKLLKKDWGNSNDCQKVPKCQKRKEIVDMWQTYENTSGQILCQHQFFKTPIEKHHSTTGFFVSRIIVANKPCMSLAGDYDCSLWSQRIKTSGPREKTHGTGWTSWGENTWGLKCEVITLQDEILPEHNELEGLWVFMLPVKSNPKPSPKPRKVAIPMSALSSVTGQRNLQ